jgi:RimJ/RimL family protein N-acetyltransferase
MKLLPLATTEQIDRVALWLADKRTCEWLDFGNGVQSPGAASLRIMIQRGTHALRLFTADEDDTPIGVVGLSNVDRAFRTATIWIALGERRFAAKGFAYRAGAMMLNAAFGELGLNSVNAWAVDTNHASLRIIRRLRFQLIGRQRQAHYIDGQAHDRLWFDLLAAEFRAPAHG